MPVDRLNIHNFRNISQASLDFSGGFNFIIGENGSGKTNLLESLYLFNHGRSFRKSQSAHMIGYGYDFFRIAAKSGGEEHVIYHPSQGNTVYSRDSKERKRSGFFPVFHPLAVSREIFNLFYYGSGERRRFFDVALFMFDPDYGQTLSRYNKILRERNALLKTGNPDPRELKVWDGYFSEYSRQVEQARTNFCGGISGGISRGFGEIFGKKREARIRYVPSMDGRGPEEFYREDIFRGVTTKGPHRDKYELLMDGKPMSSHASQGQMKSFVLSLVMSLADALEEKKGIKPVILLDDIFEELDNVRREAVREKLRRSSRQVFLTMVEDNGWPETGDSVFTIIDGEVHE